MLREVTSTDRGPWLACAQGSTKARAIDDSEGEKDDETTEEGRGGDMSSYNGIR